MLVSGSMHNRLAWIMGTLIVAATLAAVGVGFILPGLSGGVLAVIFRIYDPIIRFLSRPQHRFMKNVLYFIPIFFLFEPSLIMQGPWHQTVIWTLMNLVAIVLIAASSLVSVTLARGHAGVHILTDRLKPAPRRRLALFADIAAALTVVLLVIGSVLILADLWNGHERSELLHIPLRVLRLLMTLALTVVAIAFAQQAWTKWSRNDS